MRTASAPAPPRATTGVGVSWTHFFQQNLLIRPEAVYYTALDNPAFQQGTKYTQAVFCGRSDPPLLNPMRFLCAASVAPLEIIRRRGLVCGGFSRGFHARTTHPGRRLRVALPVRRLRATLQPAVRIMSEQRPRGRRAVERPVREIGEISSADFPRSGDVTAEIGLLLAIHLALALAVAITLAAVGTV